MRTGHVAPFYSAFCILHLNKCTNPQRLLHLNNCSLATLTDFPRLCFEELFFDGSYNYKGFEAFVQMVLDSKTMGSLAGSVAAMSIG